MYMRIYFGSCDVFMPQNFLDNAQIGTAFVEVCCQRMSKRMWADIFAYAGNVSKRFYERKNRYARQTAAEPIEKYEVFCVFFYGFVQTSVADIALQMVQGIAMYWH